MAIETLPIVDATIVSVAPPAGMSYSRKFAASITNLQVDLAGKNQFTTAGM